MSFDFPASPSEGQIFNAPGGPSYVFNTPVWKAVGQGQIAIISDTPPANPANGALWYESDSGVLFIWYNDGNSSQWVQVGGVAAGPTIRQTVITTSGTYTKPAGLRYLEVWVVGGGGGGFRAAVTAAGQGSAGGGGGGGGTGIKLYAAADLAATEAYVIGTGGAVPSGIPTAGGSSTFKDLTGGGGAPGTSQAGTANLGFLTQPQPGGVATGGDLNIAGDMGGVGVANAHGRVPCGIGGPGGGTLLAPQILQPLTASLLNGVTGNFPGGGGAGGAAGQSQPGTGLGGPGGAGCIILKEYF